MDNIKVIGVSHLIFSTDKQQKNKVFSLLKKLGYSLSFTNKFKRNSISKKKFLKFSKNKLHNIYFFTHPKFYSVEVIEYSKIFKSPQSFIPSFSKKIEKRDLKLNFHYFNSLLGKYNICDKNKIILSETNFEIFTKIGFKKLTENEYVLKTLFPKWNLKIVKNNNLKNFQRNYLDAYGFRMISFFCKFKNKPRNFIFVNSKKVYFKIKKYNSIFLEFMEVES